MRTARAWTRSWPGAVDEISADLEPARTGATPRRAERGQASVQDEQPIISIRKLNKRYASGLHALKDVDLTIFRGEIFALLGPNGAGKTTLIGVVCGIVNPTSGTVVADGHDIVG